MMRAARRGKLTTTLQLGGLAKRTEISVGGALVKKLKSMGFSSHLSGPSLCIALIPVDKIIEIGTREEVRRALHIKAGSDKV